MIKKDGITRAKVVHLWEVHVSLRNLSNTQAVNTQKRQGKGRADVRSQLC